MPGPLPQHRTELEDKKGCDRSENDYLYEIDVAHPLTIVDMRSGGARAPGRTHRQVPAGLRGARLALLSGHGHYVGNWQGKSNHGLDATAGPLFRHDVYGARRIHRGRPRQARSDNDGPELPVG